MTDHQDERDRVSIGQLLSGIMGGVLGGLFLVFVCNILWFVILKGERYPWVAPLLSSGVLILVGMYALRSDEDTGWARGPVIGLSLAFIINATCGAAALMGQPAD